MRKVRCDFWFCKSHFSKQRVVEFEFHFRIFQGKKLLVRHWIRSELFRRNLKEKLGKNMLCFSLTENLRFSFANERLNIRRSTGRSCWCAQTKWNRVRDRRFSWKTRKNSGKICSTDKKLVFASTWTIRSHYYLHRTRVKPNGKILMTHKVSHLNFFDLTDGERFFCIFPLIFVHFQWKLCLSSNSMKRIWKLHREYFYRQQINATLATEVKRSTNEKNHRWTRFLLPINSTKKSPEKKNLFRFYKLQNDL